MLVFCVYCMLRGQQTRRRADHLYRGILPGVCVCVWSINLHNEATLVLRSRAQKFSAWHTKAAPNGKCCEGYIAPSILRLTLSLLMSYIYGAPCKARNFNVFIYMDLRLAKLKAVSFYSLHNASTLNQCRKFSCGTVVCKHFASYQGNPNNKWDLIRYTKG
jgi:hypothetical protein